jgi:TPR repeat protein
LAQLYHYGNGVKRNYTKSFELYTTAANYGHPLAEHATKITSKLTWEHSIDELQNSFKDISLDYDSSLQMWEHIGNHENPELQYQLGNAYEEMGSGSDLVNENKWYSKATEHSHGPSLFRPGRLFELGLGATQDYEKAIELYYCSRSFHIHNQAYRLIKAISSCKIPANVAKLNAYNHRLVE